MISVKNLFDNDDVKIIERIGNISVIEYQRDLSVNKVTAMSEYYASKMNVRRRQVIIKMQDDEYITSSGAMQWMAGNIESKTNIKGVGDFLGKAIKGSVTSESTVKPKYHGTGILALEPTYNYLLLEDVSKWNGNMVLEDGLFLACEASLNTNVVMRTNVSSAVLGGEGLFNLKLSGNGIAVLESPVPREELIEIEDRKVYTLEDKEDDWTIKVEDGVFIVSGRAVQRLMGRVNIEDNESMYYLQKCLKNMGIEDKLKEMGVCEGDTVILDDWELEWYE